MITYGFYNSINGDRTYDATQFSSLFDGLINDGVFMNIGNQFRVRPALSGVGVIVGIGRAWLNHTWTLNDSDMNIELDAPEPTTNRIDAVVLKVDSTVSVRENSVYAVTGTPGRNPEKPTFVNTDTIHYYPLAYITVAAGVSSIDASDIENTVGTSVLPFVTGIIDSVDVDDLLKQWEAQFNVWIVKQRNDYETWISDQEANYNEWEETFTSSAESWKNNFESASKSEFEAWFDEIKGQLSEDAAGHLQNEVDEITDTEFLRYFGLTNKITTFNADGSIDQSGDGCTIHISFNEVSKTQTIITTTVTPIEGSFKYIKTTNIDDTIVTESYTKEAKGE